MKQHSRSKPQDGASDCIKGPPRPALQPRWLMSLLSGLVLALLFAWPGPRQPGRGSATSVHPITTPSELSVTAFLIYARPEDQIAEVEDHARPSHREGARGPRQACRRRDLPALAAIVAEQVQVRVPRQKLHWLTLHPRRHRQTAFRVQKARARTPRRLKQGCYQQVLHHLCPSMHPRHQQLLLRRLVLPRLFQRWSPQALRCQTRPPLLWTAPSRLWLKLHQLPRLQCLRQPCLDPRYHSGSTTAGATIPKAATPVQHYQQLMAKTTSPVRPTAPKARPPAAGTANYVLPGWTITITFQPNP